ncbi:hypothetical protein [Flagellimonas abyssi]|uniref:DUF1735 domain-containing protein n=1 Tax=Flagellimonas abyssi TaxID=2864871 RepID=A0ABS7ET50_9FLAO|nr:hypothetical protein [Allomuricauda abyssi]MBW8199972.1 hypothetical protein [Allomuricauda abyssi]
MKRYIKNIMILSLASIGFVACDSSNKTIDDVFAEVTRGAVFRATTPSSDVASQNFLFNFPTSTYSVTFEVEDNKQGELLQDVEVYASYTGADEADSVDETLVTTLPASAFSPNDVDLPSITVEFTLAELATALGLSESDFVGTIPEDYAGGSSFTIRYVLNLTDGRSFSSGNLNSTVSGGSYFKSPFVYSIPVACPPITPTPGEWTIEQQDSYGDSWNGASLSVSIDGEVTSYAHEGGASSSYSFIVPEGTVEIQIFYNSGSYDEENTFQVTSANGETVLDLGPEPPAGTALFDFCMALDL